MSHTRITVFILVIMIFISIANSSAFAQMGIDDKEARLTLKGLKGVYVGVNLFQVKGNLDEIGLSEELIRTDAELKLRSAGINVFSGEDIIKIPGAPQLFIDVMGITTSGNKESGPKQITAIITTKLFQGALLTRDSQISVSAVTWSRSGFAYGLDKNMTTYIRNVLKDCMDLFINAYLSVNPKGGK